MEEWNGGGRIMGGVGRVGVSSRRVCVLRETMGYGWVGEVVEKMREMTVFIRVHAAWVGVGDSDSVIVTVGFGGYRVAAGRVMW